MPDFEVKLGNGKKARS